jgi:hypothetical protein
MQKETPKKTCKVDSTSSRLIDVGNTAYETLENKMTNKPLIRKIDKLGYTLEMFDAGVLYHAMQSLVYAVTELETGDRHDFMMDPSESSACNLFLVAAISHIENAIGNLNGCLATAKEIHAEFLSEPFRCLGEG